MILANVTFFTATPVAPRFEQWAREVYMPAAVKAGMTDVLLCLVGEDTAQGHTSYALQMRAASTDAYEAWFRQSGSGLISSLTTEVGAANLLLHPTMMKILATDGGGE